MSKDLPHFSCDRRPHWAVAARRRCRRPVARPVQVWPSPPTVLMGGAPRGPAPRRCVWSPKSPSTGAGGGDHDSEAAASRPVLSRRRQHLSCHRRPGDGHPAGWGDLHGPAGQQWPPAGSAASLPDGRPTCRVRVTTAAPAWEERGRDSSTPAPAAVFHPLRLLPVAPGLR